MVATTFVGVQELRSTARIEVQAPPTSLWEQIHTSELRLHPMKITSVQLGRVAAGRHDKRVVTVRVKLAQAEESMRITVVVPEEADEEAAWEYGIARAKDAARQFSTCLTTSA
jgi:hypothetical protein